MNLICIVKIKITIEIKSVQLYECKDLSNVGASL